MTKSFLNYCEPLYLLINDIVKKNREVNATFFEALKEFFETFERSAIIGGFSKAEIELSKYALVALLDELVTYYYPHANHHWPARSLQLYYYQTNIAGYRFFENLNELLMDKSKNRYVLEVYYFCLQLQFKGRYQGHDDSIREYQQQLKTYFTSIEDKTDLQDVREHRVPLWLLLSVIIFLILIMYAAFTVFVNEKIFVVTADLNAYAEQLEDA